MLTYLNLSENNFLEIDLNVETVLKVKLDGDITTTRSENNIEYVCSGVKITVNTTPLEWRFEIHTDTITFDVSYVDFPEAPEMLTNIMTTYMSRR
jgi:hypothetical protein